MRKLRISLLSQLPDLTLRCILTLTHHRPALHRGRSLMSMIVLLLLLLHFALGIAKRNVLWPRPSVCVCLSLAALPHYCTDPDVVLGER